MAGAVTGAAVWPLASRGRPAAITFDVHAPEGSQFERRTMAPFPALSPDGRRLAYAAMFGAAPVIWIQTVGGIDARPLAESTGASFPFWSPDGRFVAFVVEGRLRKFAVDDNERPLLDICVCDARYGGVWSNGWVRLSSGVQTALTASPRPAARRNRVQTASTSRAASSRTGTRGCCRADGASSISCGATRRSIAVCTMGSLDDPAIKRRLVSDESNASYARAPKAADCCSSCAIRRCSRSRSIR